MRRMAALAALAALGLAPAAAHADTFTVNAQFQDFGPSTLDILPGETVQWENVSERTHTVTADEGSFDSGDLAPAATFTRVFENAGTFAYHCTKHAGMVGEVDVRWVTLGPLPTAAVPAGGRGEFEGRSADPLQPVHVERAVGDGFQTAGSTMPAADGSWRVELTAQSTGDFRAVSNQGASELRHLIVSDRKVLVRATRRGVSVTVTPALPYGRIALQRDLLERFGWWITARSRLDYVSTASFKLEGPGRVRVLLVDKDGWTALATSSTLKLRAAK